jgi:hypothetical protein
MLVDFEKFTSIHNISKKGVIHIGAHYGKEIETYQKTNVENILFFEPLSLNFSVLKDRVSHFKNVKLENCALGDTEGTIKMHVEEKNQGQSSSILKPRGHLFQYPHIQFTKEETVNITTLDKYSQNNDLKDYNIIVIDVQGYELPVFKGAINTLNNIDMIISEVNRAELYENVTMVPELDAFLSSFNFKRVFTNWEGHTWGDAVYIKEKN